MSIDYHHKLYFWQTHSCVVRVVTSNITWLVTYHIMGNWHDRKNCGFHILLAYNKLFLAELFVYCISLWQIWQPQMFSWWWTWYRNFVNVFCHTNFPFYSMYLKISFSYRLNCLMQLYNRLRRHNWMSTRRWNCWRQFVLQWIGMYKQRQS